MRTDRNDPEEQEDHRDDDDQRLAERREHLVDGVLDVSRRVVGNPRLHPGRHVGLDERNLFADLPDHLERVGGRQDPDAHEHRRLAVEPDVLLVVLGAEHHVGDVAEPDDHALVFLDDQVPELLRRAQIGVGDQVHRGHRTLRSPERREGVVPGERVAQHRRRNAVSRHEVRLEPDPHGEGPIAEDVGALDAGDRAQPRLNDANQVVGDLVLIEVRRREAEVHRRELRVGVLDLDDRRLGLGRQVVPHLRHLRLDLRQRVVGVVVEAEVDGDRAQPLRARRLHVIDAVGAGDHPLERRRDEAADEVGIRADVRRRDADDRDIAARVLADAQGADRLEAGDQNHQADDDREHRAPDEDVGEPHQLFSGFGAGLLAGRTLLLITTAAPLRSLKTPEVTTSSPALRPDATAI